ncbi:hypothetical protein C8F01DRAFT_1271360 [Mycena amicta]|nr:hypothetical protein C8F01DRAFT_1271360 [Mycena amicta]
MVRPRKATTPAATTAARATRQEANIKYESSVAGRAVRSEARRCRHKRKVAKNHLSRVTLPDLVEDWAAASLRDGQWVFKAAQDDEFEDDNHSHWLQPPPFDQSALTAADEPDEHDIEFTCQLCCLIDGRLLNHECHFEKALQEEFTRLGRKKAHDRMRVEVQRLRRDDWPAMKALLVTLPLGTRECLVFEHHLIFLVQRISRIAPLTNELILPLKTLTPDTDLPEGELRSFVDLDKKQHAKVCFAGRVAAHVKTQTDEVQFVVLHAIPDPHLEEDFQAMVEYLLPPQRVFGSRNAKHVSFWAIEARLHEPATIYVHLTPGTHITTHAWDRGDDWLRPPKQEPIEPIELDADVLCIMNLLRVSSVLNPDQEVQVQDVRLSSNFYHQRAILHCDGGYLGTDSSIRSQHTGGSVFPPTASTFDVFTAACYANQFHWSGGGLTDGEGVERGWEPYWWEHFRREGDRRRNNRNQPTARGGGAGTLVIDEDEGWLKQIYIGGSPFAMATLLTLLNFKKHGSNSAAGNVARCRPHPAAKTAFAKDLGGREGKQAEEGTNIDFGGHATVNDPIGHGDHSVPGIWLRRSSARRSQISVDLSEPAKQVLWGVTSTRSRKKKAKSTFHFDDSVHNAAVDQRFCYSADGRRLLTTLSNPALYKSRRHEEDEGPEEYADWVHGPEFNNGDLAAVADTLSSNDAYFHQIEESEVLKGKRPRYQSSDWAISNNDLPVDNATLRTIAPMASTFSAASHAGLSFNANRVFEWNGDYWTKVALHRMDIRDVSSQSLGLSYQLGHHSSPCPLPASATARTLVMIDVKGVFTLNVFFCGCSSSLHNNHVAQLMSSGWYPATTIDPATCTTFESLELFRELNVVGNLSVHDYVGTLERVTGATRLEDTPDRYKAFGRMSRQYRFLKRCKRAGLGHKEMGFENVAPGELAEDCWACPHPDLNLPEGWETCSPGDRFLYSLMLALDANFRLKNRIRANERQDPSLGSGWSYFVENAAYKEHLRDYVQEKDYLHRICGAHAEGHMVNDRLACFGGRRMCLCAAWGSAGAGVGGSSEGYANMDCILMHALGDTRVKELVFSYDIACQWKVHLRERVKAIVMKSGAANLDEFRIRFGLPVWHAAAHEINCREALSLSHIVGVGRTDGEGIERTWVEMGEGNRHDTIEDKVDHMNFEKNVGEGDALARKLIIATAERDKQMAEFMEVDWTIEPGLRGEWQALIDEWLVDDTKPNPYVMAGGKDAGPSEAQVAAELKKAEVEEAREGRGEFAAVAMTAVSVVKGLLQLEDVKRRIKAEVRGQTVLTADRESQIKELRASFFKKLKTIQRHQDVYMPGVAALRAKEEDRRDKDLPPPKAEDIKLCLLYAKTHLIHQRNTSAVGQSATTRSSSLIGRMTERIAREVTKYRQVLLALRRLQGESVPPEFRELLDSDLNVRAETESDAAARTQLGRIGSSRPACNEPTAAQVGPVSWIWFATGDDEEVRIHEAVRVQWSKSLARKDRWVEEVKLLWEEMKRVLRSLRAIQLQWKTREMGRAEVEGRLASGLKAYAKRRVAFHRHIAERFYNNWTTRKGAAGVVVGQDGLVYRCILDGESEIELPVAARASRG